MSSVPKKRESARKRKKEDDSTSSSEEGIDKKRKVATPQAGGVKRPAAEQAAPSNRAAKRGRYCNYGEGEADEVFKVIQETGLRSLTAASKLAEWDGLTRWFAAPIFALLVGKRNTGKTTWAFNFCYHRRNVYAYVWVLAGAKQNNQWQQIVPNKMILNELDDNFLAELIKVQTDRTKKRGVNSRVLLIIDDFAYKNLFHNETLGKIAQLGRHYSIDCLFLTQHYHRAPTWSRTNADFLVILPTENRTTLAQLYDEYGLAYRSKDDFEMSLVSNSTKEESVIIDNTDPSKHGGERIFICTDVVPMEDLPTFQMGCDDAWGGKASEKAAEQRKKFPLLIHYSESYNAKLKNQAKTKIKPVDYDGKTAQHALQNDIDPFFFVKNVVLANYSEIEDGPQWRPASDSVRLSQRVNAILGLNLSKDKRE